MSEIGKELLERLHSMGVKNELGEMEFPQGTAGKMTVDICVAIAKLDERLDAFERALSGGEKRADGRDQL